MVGMSTGGVLTAVETGTGMTADGVGTGFADGATMTVVEPCSSDPVASAVPTTMPSTATIGSATIALTADARSERTPGRSMTTVWHERG